MSTQSTYTVTGMTCQHCVSAVTTELGRLPGVEAVRVDLPHGRVEVTSSGALPVEAVRSAIDEAGYQLADGHG